MRNQFEFRSLRLLLCLYLSLIFFPQAQSRTVSDLAQLPHQLSIMHRPVYFVWQARLAWGAGRLPKADTSVSISSLNSRIYAES